MSRKRILVAVAVVVVSLVLVAGAGVAWVLRGDAPAAVDLDAAASGVVTDSSTTAVDEDTAGVSGMWTVDAATGSFDYESATGTFAGFRINEVLGSVGSTTAVGRTGEVDGELGIDGSSVSSASFTVDLTSITTNESRRDDKVQSALATSSFPTATFELTEPIVLGDGAESGSTVTTTATGDLTIHGVTRSVEFALQARLVDDTIVVVGSTDLVFSDYGVSVPTSPAVLSVEDHGTLEVQLLLVKA